MRVYHGAAARLPKHYVSRQRLCLRATTDYWVNATDGQPFFVVHQPVDPGLLQVLEAEIIPRLEREVPGQPTAAALAADPTLDKFILVFDREGYSPAALQRFKEKRIGCLTYHKHPGPDWPVAEFVPVTVKLVHGNTEELRLAERRTTLSNGFAVREIRHLDEGSGHQTAVLATAQKLTTAAAAAAMFARWSQENFLKYMREHYALDRLLSYQVEPLPETTQVVNPAWRRLDRAVRRLTAKLQPRLARFGALTLAEPIEPTLVEAFLKKKAAAQPEIATLQTQLQAAKAQRLAVAQQVPLGQVPEAQRLDRLSTGSKDLVATIKLVAYRAETAMAHVLREALPKWRQEEERRLLQSLYLSEADLLPDPVAGTLTVRLHYPANALLARAVAALCAELTATETLFPTTQLRLVYELTGGVPAGETGGATGPPGPAAPELADNPITASV